MKETIQKTLDATVNYAYGNNISLLDRLRQEFPDLNFTKIKDPNGNEKIVVL